MAAERERQGESERHVPRDPEEASRPSTSLDHWEAQSVDVHKTAFPVYEEDDDRGLSRTFRISIIAASIFIMIAVILCLVVVLPRSGRRKVLEVMSGGDLIMLACRATRFPELCEFSLKSDPSAVAATQAEDLVKAAMSVASKEVVHSHDLAQGLLTTSGASVNLTAAARNCEYLLRRAESFFERSEQVTALASQIEDVQAWMSAVLTYENDCRSALSYVNTTQMVALAMEDMEYVIELTSNALSMVYAFRTYGSDMGQWQPPTRMSVAAGSATANGGGSGGGNWPSSARVTVSKDGTGQFETIQAAVDAAPEGLTERFTIYVKRGLYEETVVIPAEKPLLALVGDGMDETVITGSRNVQMPGVTTYDSATVVVDGDGFVAVGMTFENTAGPAMHQAVALRVDSDLAAFYNCSILGFQDTLYVHSLRQFFRDCRIEGTIDFVFGNSAAVFQNCQILIRPGIPGVATSVAAAHGRTDPAETTGLVFHNCSLDGTPAFLQAYLSSPYLHHVYLGRPWKLFSRSVFLESILSGIIRPDGWLPWNNSTFALDTLFFAEYLDSGPGANPAQRIFWSSQISNSEAVSFTISPFIQGDRWLPATNVPFTLALQHLLEEESVADSLGS